MEETWDNYLTCCDICCGEDWSKDMVIDWDNNQVCTGCAPEHFALAEPDWKPDWKLEINRDRK